MRLLTSIVAISAVALTACSNAGSLPPEHAVSSGAESPSQSQRAGPPSAASPPAAPGAVLYTLSNQTASSRVLRFVSSNDTLVASGSFDTKGRGDPSIAAAVQGALAFNADRRFLFAVDPGSDEITSFSVGAAGLQFNGKVGSQGTQPVSLTVHGDLLYVLNAASSSIHGFRIGANGQLSSIDGSTRPLSERTAVGPAQIGFDPAGAVLVVTEKMTNRIDTFRLDGDLARGPSVHPSSGQTPFGFAFVPQRDTLVVSEAFGGAADKGAASSYDVDLDALTPLTRSVADRGSAPCWFVITPDGGRAFTSNTASATISSYAVDAGGTLHLSHAVAAATGQGPADLALIPQGDLLSVLNTKGNAIELFRADAGGALTAVATANGLPPGAVGLVASN